MGRASTFISIGEVIADMWREEIKRHWPLRGASWRREIIRQYVMLIRLREDKRPHRLIALYKQSR